jgi:hypothetical protein
VLKYQKPSCANNNNKETGKAKIVGAHNSGADQNYKDTPLPSYQPHLSNIVKKQNNSNKLTDDIFTSQSRLKSELIEKIAKTITLEKNNAQPTNDTQEAQQMQYNSRKEALKMVAELSSTEINALAKATSEDIKLLLRSLVKKNRDGY